MVIAQTVDHHAMKHKPNVFSKKKKGSLLPVTGSVDGEKTLNNRLIGDTNSHMNWCPSFCYYINTLMDLMH